MSAEARRRLILHMSVSFDGFVARRDGDIDWLTDGRPGVDHGDHRHHANGCMQPGTRGSARDARVAPGLKVAQAR